MPPPQWIELLDQPIPQLMPNPHELLLTAAAITTPTPKAIIEAATTSCDVYPGTATGAP
jgi:hypothetical protein